MNPATAPDDRQLDNIRAELHAIADRCCDAWPQVRRRQSEMSRGLGRGASGGVPTGSGDPTYGAATAAGVDPAVDLARWLRLFSEFVVRAYELENKRTGLMPTSADMKNVNASAHESCPECGRPVLRGKRLDGSLYHDGGDDPACWWKAYNARHGRRPAESECGERPA